MTDEQTNEPLGSIRITITDDEISYDSELDIANIVFFLELTKSLIIKHSMEKPD